MTSVRVRYLVPPEREEEVVAALWELGTLGVQVVEAGAGEVRLEAYFDGPAPGAVAGIAPMGSEQVPAQDWLASYRAAARPFPVGERLWLDPREPEAPEEPAPPGRRTLRIPARGAFGTGSHESTRLVLEMLEEMPLAGRRVLDVGTGTGVLSLAALALGAHSALGLDVDPAAPFHARENRRLDGLDGLGGRGPILLAGTLRALRPPPSGARFDLALVNVIPEVIAPDLPLLPPLLGDIFGVRAEVVVSGALAASRSAVLATWSGLGFRPVAERAAGEWVAFRLERRPGGPP
jgi:ribosomal protein L11 methyltransferase